MMRKELEGKIQGRAHAELYITCKVSFKRTQGPKIQHQKVHVFPRQTDSHGKCYTFDAVFADYCALLKSTFIACTIKSLIVDHI